MTFFSRRELPVFHIINEHAVAEKKNLQLETFRVLLNMYFQLKTRKTSRVKEILIHAEFKVLLDLLCIKKWLPMQQTLHCITGILSLYTCLSFIKGGAQFSLVPPCFHYSTLYTSMCLGTSYTTLDLDFNTSKPFLKLSQLCIDKH